MREVIVAGVGMTPFGKHPDSSVRSLAGRAAAAALADAGVAPGEVGMVCFGNAAQGLLDGQEMIRGQAALRHTDLLGAPIVNVENACASSSSAFHLAWLAVAAGVTDAAVAVGAEKLTHPDKSRTFRAIGSAVDLAGLEELERRLAGSGAEAPPGGDRSVFMDIYAAQSRRLMRRTGATEADFAAVVEKNRHHATLNPMAQYQEPVSAAEVLASRPVVPPLRLLMCSPVGDGAAAVVLTSADLARRLGAPAVRVLASTLVSGTDHPDQPTAVERAAGRAYAQAGVGPADLDLVELHDATAPAELMLYEELGLCPPGEASGLLAAGHTRLGGRCPVNLSGGLLAKGHPIGATGCAQLVELTQQLRGRAGPRQATGARMALAQNGGGYLTTDIAATAVTVLGT